MSASLDVYSDNSGALDQSHSHPGGAGPEGALVFVLDAVATPCTAVTYGGQACSKVTEFNGVGELSAGHFSAWRLVTGAPSGTQNVVTNGSATPSIFVYSLNTAGEPLEEIDFEIINTVAANPSATLSLGGRTSFVALLFGSGQQSVGNVAPSANWTSRDETDVGNQVVGSYSYNNIASSDVAAGWTQTSEDAYMIAVALSEAVAVEEDADVTAGASLGASFDGDVEAVATFAASVSLGATLAGSAEAQAIVSAQLSAGASFIGSKQIDATIEAALTAGVSMSALAEAAAQVSEGMALGAMLSGAAQAIASITESFAAGATVRGVATAAASITESVGLGDADQAAQVIAALLAAEAELGEAHVGLAVAQAAIEAGLSLVSDLEGFVTANAILAAAAQFTDSFTGDVEGSNTGELLASFTGSAAFLGLVEAFATLQAQLDADASFSGDATRSVFVQAAVALGASFEGTIGTSELTPVARVLLDGEGRTLLEDQSGRIVLRNPNQRTKL